MEFELDYYHDKCIECYDLQKGKGITLLLNVCSFSYWTILVSTGIKKIWLVIKGYCEYNFIKIGYLGIVLHLFRAST